MSELRCLRLTATSSSLRLIAKMTSSVKPEIRNISLRRHRRTEPRTRVTCTNEIWRRSGVQFGRYDRGQTNTDIHSHDHHNTPLRYRGGAGTSAGLWLGGSMPPCRLRRRKFRKFDYEMVHSEVYLNKHVVSIAPFSTPACSDCSQNIT